MSDLAAPADAETKPAQSTSEANASAAQTSTEMKDLMDTGKESGRDNETDHAATGTAPGAASGAEIVAPEGGDGESSSKKNNGKRRSSAGIPEHKSKKPNSRKKSMAPLNLDAKPGDHYWARMKGYPPWPAIICDEDMIPESLLQNRPVTAMRPDGTYREDFQEGGKNARDRTYPIMYLGSYEFSWIPNTDISPIDLEEIKQATAAKKTKGLWSAYEQAQQGNDLGHYKDLLREFEVARQQAEEEAAQEAAEKAAKKAKKEKRKSKDAVVDGEDVVMEDGGDGEKKTKPTPKKRKKDAESENEAKPAKTPKSIKLSTTKTPNGDSASKAKAKSKTPKSAKSTPKADPPLSEAEKKEKRQKEILYFRHKLQKGFLTTDVPPKEEEMKQMAEYFDSLEKQKDLDASIIRNTKIHKVMKAIVKLTSIPKDEDYRFKARSMDLLERWQKTLGEESGAGASESKAEANGAPLGGEKVEADKPANSVEGQNTSSKADAPEASAEEADSGNDAKHDAVDGDVAPKPEDAADGAAKSTEEGTSVAA